MKIQITFFVFFLSLLILITGANAQTTFEKQVIDDYFGGTASVCAADVDADGKLDVLAAGSTGGLAWWRNHGGMEPSWSRQPIDADFNNGISIVTADIDSDQHLDVVACSMDLNQVAWWQNDGGFPINWTKHVIDYTFGGAHEVFVCDFDDDGDPDVFGAAASGNCLAWWRNDGGTWQRQNIALNFVGVRSLVAADLDADGDKDVVGAALDANKIAWWRNDGGNPVTWTEQVLSEQFYGAHRVNVCDMDFDGDSDILATAFASNEIAWWRNEAGVWTKQLVDNQFQRALNAHAADFDRDGDIDVVATSQPTHDIGWWENSDGQWIRHILSTNFGGAWPVMVGDLDHDGDTDILAGGWSANEVAWWRNKLYEYKFSADPPSGHAPLTVKFTDLSSSSLGLTDWNWDFDGDSVIDATTPNPVWTFAEPGEYDISWQVNGAMGERTFVCPRFVRVFDGESALEFDGNESRVQLPATPNLNLTGAFTFETWIKPSGWGGVPREGRGRILDKIQFSLYLVGDLRDFQYNSFSLALEASYQNGTCVASSPQNSIELGVWQHIAVCYNGSDTLKCFINGEMQALTQMKKPSGGLKDNLFYDLIIGASMGNVGTFQGVIDAVRIWNTARSGSQIQATMRKYLTGDETGLVACWQMNEAFGDSIHRLNSSENTGHLFNTEWIQGAPVGVPTRIAQPNLASTQNEFRLFANYPNPFNATTVLSYSLPQAALVELAIYDTNGRLVKRLFQGNQAAGHHQLCWDGTDQFNRAVSSGVYFQKITAGEFIQTQKLIFMK